MTRIFVGDQKSTLRSLPAQLAPAFLARHLVARAGREITDVGAMRGLGIPRVAQDVAVGIERMHVAFPRVAVHLDMLSHPTS